MNCKEVQEILWQYCSKELESEFETQVEIHIQTCGSCAKEKSLVEKTIQQISDQPKLPETYWESYQKNVLHRLEMANQKRWEWSWAPAFALFFILIVGFVYYRTHKMSETEKQFTTHDNKPWESMSLEKQNSLNIPLPEETQKKSEVAVSSPTVKPSTETVHLKTLK